MDAAANRGLQLDGRGDHFQTSETSIQRQPDFGEQGPRVQHVVQPGHPIGVAQVLAGDPGGFGGGTLDIVPEEGAQKRQSFLLQVVLLLESRCELKSKRLGGFPGSVGWLGGQLAEVLLGFQPGHFQQVLQLIELDGRHLLPRHAQDGEPTACRFEDDHLVDRVEVVVDLAGVEHRQTAGDDRRRAGILGPLGGVGFVVDSRVNPELLSLTVAAETHRQQNEQDRCNCSLSHWQPLCRVPSAQCNRLTAALLALEGCEDEPDDFQRDFVLDGRPARFERPYNFSAKIPIRVSG